MFLSVCLNLSLQVLCSKALSVQKHLGTTCKKEGAAILPPVILENPVRYLSKELSHFEHCLANKITPWDAQCSDVSLCVSKDKYDEVMHAAATIRTFVADTGASYRDIAVIAGDYDGYSDLVQSIFPMFDIPVFIDTRQDF